MDNAVCTECHKPAKEYPTLKFYRLEMAYLPNRVILKHMCEDCMGPLEVINEDHKNATHLHSNQQ